MRLPARGEYLAGNDQPFTGTDGGAGGGHVLRAAGSTPAVVEAISKAEIGYDQLILEHPGTSGSWAHLGLHQVGGRRQNLTALKRNGRTVYVEGFQY